MTILFHEDEWDFCAHNELPARSALFSLEPVGVGTSQQESLLSLLLRTSNAHAVNPRLLIRDVLPKADAGIARLSTPIFHQRLAGTINGLGRYAEVFTSALKTLTGRANLRHLTMLPWQPLFPHNGQGLLARRRRWCPECLLVQRQQGEPTAFPLAWSLEAYQACVTHHVPLAQDCPSCDKAQPFIPWFPDLAVCGHCGKFLGGTGPHSKPSSFHLWIGEAVGDMVARQSVPGFTPSPDRFRDFLCKQIAIHAGGNRTAFCRAVGLNKFAVSGWLNKGERTSIAQFLTLCYGASTMPVDVFGDSCSPKPNTDLRKPLGKLKERNACPRLEIDRRAAVKRVLQSHLKTGDGRSVAAIGKELGLSRTYLRYWFPDLCRLLSEKHQAAARKRSEEMRRYQRQSVEKVVRILRDEGNIPSKRKVNKLLNADGLSLSQPHLMEAYREALENVTTEARRQQSEFNEPSAE